MPPKKRNSAAPTKLREALALQRWVLSLFGHGDFQSLVRDMKDPELSGWSDSGESRYFQHLLSRSHGFPGLDEAALREYDGNIRRHTVAVSARRTEAVSWTFFQYVALLFAEIYLDRYFSDPARLLEDLNAFLAGLSEPEPAFSAVEPFSASDLNKVAFWSATWSWKTFLMHVNVLQFRHYAAKAGREGDFNRTVVLTPNEGLSRQHETELRNSGFWAEMFDKKAVASSRPAGMVDVIDIHKLEEEAGDKTVAIEWFETNNLVLVDEGHRGSSGDEWKSKRERLCENGFSFEYSATFEQAVHAAGGKKREKLLSEYSKAVLMDYSYKHFYGDGYGKDYRIMNLSSVRDEEMSHAYLVGAMLSFYEQALAFGTEPSAASFLIEKPLAVFVGGTVKAVRSESGGKVSDVVRVLKFFESLLREPERTRLHIGNLLSGKDGIGTLFLNRFHAVREAFRTESWSVDAGAVYLDFLDKVFNCRVPGAWLHVEMFKGKDGEIGLRAGNGEYFGVVNVGDAPELVKLCESEGIVTSSKEFAESLFRTIDSKNSTVNVLIGSKKFSEWWSSWRVSTMGLMNVGRSEWSEIIQLFGRWVRLKGKGMCLRRSRQLEKEGLLERWSVSHKVRLLETLCVFGVRSEYMDNFKGYLEAEGVPSSDSETLRIDVKQNFPRRSADLKCLSVQSSAADFRKSGIRVEFATDPRAKVTADWYAKFQSIESERQRAAESRKETHALSPEHLEFVDWDAVYFELQRQKAERAWTNFSIPPESVRPIFSDPSWYSLSIPGPFMEFRYANVRIWNEMAVFLAKAYADALYNLRKGLFYRDRMAVVPLSEHGGNAVASYEVRVDPSEEAFLASVRSMAAAAAEGKLLDLEIPEGLSSVHFDRHLYTPLLALASDVWPERISVSPVPLNEGEKAFVSDLRSYFLKSPDLLAGKEMFLLRNLSRKGIGFFEAHNFYPDFILWVLEGNRQRVVFVDPKGLRNVDGGFDNPKLRLYETLKALPIGDPDLELDSYILSVTPFRELRHWKGQDGESDFEARHVVFQTGNYVERMLRSVFTN